MPEKALAAKVGEPALNDRVPAVRKDWPLKVMVVEWPAWRWPQWWPEPVKAAGAISRVPSLTLVDAGVGIRAGEGQGANAGLGRAGRDWKSRPRSANR